MPDTCRSSPRVEQSLQSSGWRAVALGACLPVIHALILTLSGGGLWLRAWLYLATFTALVVVETIYLSITSPTVLNARGESHIGTQSWDRTILRFHVIFMLTTLIIAGLDGGRYEWSSVPPSISVIGLALVVLGFGLASRAMAENPHFEPTVRLQSDRNHRVIVSGPYRWVRHPGYLGMMLGTVGIPLALGSFFALLPATVVVSLLTYRTLREDRFLAAELQGYRQYREVVRHRLLPFW